MIYRGCRLKCRISKSIQNLERYRTLKYGQRVQNVLKCMFHIETLRFFSDGVKFSDYISRYVYHLLVGCSVYRSEVHDWLPYILKTGDNLRMS